MAEISYNATDRLVYSRFLWHLEQKRDLFQHFECHIVQQAGSQIWLSCILKFINGQDVDCASGIMVRYEV